VREELIGTEHPQLPIPRVAGYRVDVLAESVQVNGEYGTAEDYRIAVTQVRRAVKMWEEWQERNNKSQKV